MTKKEPLPVSTAEEMMTENEGQKTVELTETEKKLAEAEKLRDEYLDLAQRVQADFENFRRRNRQVASESFEDGARAFIKTILPVCDNLERALMELREEDPLYEGVQLVLRQLLDALNQRGVQTVSRLGEAFDPTLEDAVAQGDSSEGEPGTVCEVLQKGYRMGDSILRHAMVRVVPDL